MKTDENENRCTNCGAKIELPTIKGNTLGIIDMKIMDTKEFFRNLYGKTITIWTMDGALYAIEHFVTETFVKKKEIFQQPAIVLKGAGEGETFAIECYKGFGISPFRGKESYWIDKVNSKDIAIIVYERNNEVK